MVFPFKNLHFPIGFFDWAPSKKGLTCAGAGFAAGGAALVAMPAVGLSEAQRGDLVG